MAKVESRVEKTSASIAKLTELSAALSKDIAEIDASMADATAVRSEEKAQFMKAQQDLSESEQACAAAISVLREYYESAALVQVRSRVTLRTSMQEEGDGTGILSIL